MPGVRSRDFIAFSKVTKNFQAGTRTSTAIRDVSLSIRRGEIVMLLGPSGCGKSTLLNLIAGPIAPSQGRVVSRSLCPSRMTSSTPSRLR